MVESLSFSSPFSGRNRLSYFRGSPQTMERVRQCHVLRTPERKGEHLEFEFQMLLPLQRQPEIAPS